MRTVPAYCEFDVVHTRASLAWSAVLFAGIMVEVEDELGYRPDWDVAWARIRERLASV